MKKNYQKPEAEKVEFDYREQVVAESGFLGYYTADYEGGRCTHDYKEQPQNNG